MAQAKTNGYDKVKLEKYLSRVAEKDAEMESSKGQHMKRCRDARESIDGILTEADAAGFPKKIMKSLIKVRRKQNELDAVRDRLEPDEQDSLDLMMAALGPYGDTPLGAAAIEKTKAKRETKEAAVDTFGKVDDEPDVRPPHLKDWEKQREAEKGEKPSVEGIEHLDGIKALPDAEGVDVGDQKLDSPVSRPRGRPRLVRSAGA